MNVQSGDDILVIGNDYVTDGANEDRGFRGNIDDVALFGRALTAEEVQALYTIKDLPNY